MKKTLQKDFCEAEARRLDRSESWVYKRLRQGYYRGLILQLEPGYLRHVVGAPVLTEKPGHKIKVVHSAAVTARRVARFFMDGATLGKPRLTGYKKATCGVRDTNAHAGMHPPKHWEPSAPICGSTLADLNARLAEIDARCRAQV